MRCPVCDLENPPSAEECDCGHAFMANLLRERSNVERITGKKELIDILRYQSEFNARPVESSASSLISWGRVSIVIGIIAMIIGIPVWISSTISVLVIGLTLLAQGTLLLAGGRMISCLVAIERNTRIGRVQ